MFAFLEHADLGVGKQGLGLVVVVSNNLILPLMAYATVAESKYIAASSDNFHIQNVYTLYAQV